MASAERKYKCNSFFECEHKTIVKQIFIYQWGSVIYCMVGAKIESIEVVDSKHSPFSRIFFSA
jgi:hypothetical protein